MTPACIDGDGKGTAVALRDVRRQLGYFDKTVSVSSPTTTPSQTSPVKSPSASQTSQSNRMSVYLDRIRQGRSSQVGGSQEGGGQGGLRPEDASAPARGSVLTDLDASKGVTMVGAVPFIQNFNMRFRPLDPRSLVVQGRCINTPHQHTHHPSTHTSHILLNHTKPSPPIPSRLNMRFRPFDFRSLVVQVTAAVREHGTVEALTLPHNDG